MQEKIEKNPGEDFPCDVQERDSTVVSINASIAFLEDGENIRIFQVFFFSNS